LTGAGTGHCRVVGGHERVGVVHVDTQQFAEQAVGVLGLVAGIARTAAVTGGHIEHAVRTELKLPAVVVGRGLIDGEKRADRCGVSSIRQALVRRNRRLVFLNHGLVGVTSRPGVVDEKAPIGGKVGMKRQAQQSAFTQIAGHPVADVEKHLVRRLQHARRADADASGLFDDEQPAAVVEGRLQVRRVVQAVVYPHQHQAGQGVGRLVRRRGCGPGRAAQ
jgi:hypothetical protein